MMKPFAKNEIPYLIRNSNEMCAYHTVIMIMYKIVVTVLKCDTDVYGVVVTVLKCDADVYGVVVTVLDYDTDYVWNYSHYGTVTQTQFHATLML